MQLRKVIADESDRCPGCGGAIRPHQIAWESVGTSHVYCTRRCGERHLARLGNAWATIARRRMRESVA